MTSSNDRRLVQQRMNLERFVQAENKRFSLCRYSPWTVSSDRKTHLELKNSTLLPGTVGVFSTIQSKAHSLVATYPGVLMWDELHEEFQNSYHCPTCVRLTVLDYYVDEKTAKSMKLNASKQNNNQWLVQMVLVGDPTSPGAIINSPFGLKNVSANCVLRTCKQSDVHRYYLNKNSNNQPLKISAEIVAVHQTSVSISKPAETELLVAYDSSEFNQENQVLSDENDPTAHLPSFWLESQNNEIEDQFCDRCFCKDYTTEDSDKNNNPLVLCSGLNGSKPCPVARHKICFYNHLMYQHTDWFCIKHSKGRPSPLPPRPTTVMITPPLNSIERPSFTHQWHAASNLSSKIVDVNSAAPSKIIQRAPVHPPYLHKKTPCLSLSSSSTTLSPPEASSTLPASQTVTLTNTASSSNALNTCTTEYECLTDNLECYDYDSHSSNDSTDDEDDDKDDSNAAASVDEAPDIDVLNSAASNNYSKRCMSMTKQQKIGHTINGELSPQQKIEVMKVWELFEAAILKFNRRAKWHLNSSSSVEKQEKSFLELNQYFQAIQACCCSNNPGLYVDVNTPAKLLHIQLEFFGRFRFDREVMHAHVRSLLDQGNSKSSTIEGKMKFCNEHCLIQIARTSKSSIYRSTQRDSVLVSKMTKERNASTREQIVFFLLQLIKDYGQDKPTDEGTRAQPDVIHKVLPYRTKDDCISAIAERASLQDGRSVVVCRSSFTRAVKYLYKTKRITINITKQKGLAGCEICAELQGKISKARMANDATAIELANRIFAEHTKEWMQQRKLFEDKKNIALMSPWTLNVITGDGMDTVKTALPSFQRFSKHADSENRLPLRIFGAFYYGGPIPCIALSTFDNVPGKGGSAAVTYYEKIFDMQYEAMDPTRIAPTPDMQSSVDSSIDAALNSMPPSRSHSVASNLFEASAAAVSSSFIPTMNSDILRSTEECKQNKTKKVSPSDSSFDPVWDPYWKEQPVKEKQKADFMWPEGAHVTFDNTASDSKNSHVFNFFGQLVALGVFLFITVSTLLVGHTHDIVDQMFSVWSRQLNLKDAQTLSALHLLFRSKYETSIYELQKFVDQINAPDLPSYEVSKKKVKIRHCLRQVANRLKKLAIQFGVQPELIQQDFIVDIDSWYNKKIPNVVKPHVFYIVKEKVLSEETNEEVEVVAIVMQEIRA